MKQNTFSHYILLSYLRFFNNYIDKYLHKKKYILNMIINITWASEKTHQFQKRIIFSKIFFYLYKALNKH